jgi:hypothetical protein
VLALQVTHIGAVLLPRFIELLLKLPCLVDKSLFRLLDQPRSLLLVCLMLSLVPCFLLLQRLHLGSQHL